MQARVAQSTLPSTRPPLSSLINSPEHARRQGDVDAFGFVRQRGNVNRDQSSCPALEFTLALVLAQRLGLGRRPAVVDGDGVVHHRLLAFNYENRFASAACAEDRCPNPFWDEAP